MHKVHFQHHTMQSKKMSTVLHSWCISCHAFLARSKELVWFCTSQK